MRTYVITRMYAGEYLEHNLGGEAINLLHDDHNNNYVFVGKIGQFCPILPGCGGGELLSLRGESDYYAVQGTKGYRFLESEMVKNLRKEKDINESYFLELANEAIDHISEFGSYDEFVG